MALVLGERKWYERWVRDDHRERIYDTQRDVKKEKETGEVHGLLQMANEERERERESFTGLKKVWYLLSRSEVV